MSTAAPILENLVSLGGEHRYNRDTHEYFDGPQLVPSVTQIIESAGLDTYDFMRAQRPEQLKEAADLGLAVHLACELLDRGEFAGASERVTPYVLAWEKFKNEMEFTCLQIEERAVGKLPEGPFGYCVDRSGFIKGEAWLIDLKTSKALQKNCGVQLAAYSLGINEHGSFRRGVAQLSSDGSYKFREYQDDADFDVFRAALRIAHWKLANKVKLRK